MSIVFGVILMLGPFVLERLQLDVSQMRALPQVIRIALLIPPLGALIGFALCCAIPRASGALPYTQLALFTGVVALLLNVGEVQTPVVGGYSLVTLLEATSLLSFAWFTYTLSFWVNRPDLANRCLRAVGLYLLSAVIMDKMMVLLELGVSFLGTMLISMALRCGALLLYISVLSGVLAGLEERASASVPSTQGPQ